VGSGCHRLEKERVVVVVAKGRGLLLDDDDDDNDRGMTMKASTTTPPLPLCIDNKEEERWSKRKAPHQWHKRGRIALGIISCFRSE